jgi:carboxyl-terminal processing protease
LREPQTVSKDRDRRNKKVERDNRFWKGVLAGALVTAFAGLIVVGLSAGIFLFGSGIIRKNQGKQGPGYELEQQAADKSGIAGDEEALPAQAGTDGEKGETNGLDYQQIARKMQMIQKLIDKEFLFEEDFREVEETIYLGMLAGLGDPYSTYYTPEELDQLLEETEGEYSGIGALVSQNRLTGLISILKVYDGTPSQEAGMEAGDQLYKVDGEDITGLDLDVLVNSRIKGAEGSKVEIEVYRPSVEDFVVLNITRRKIEVPTVEYEMLENQVGYLTVSQFDVVTESQFENAIDDMMNQGMEKLIIDLRNNPGGVMQTALAMLDYVLEDHITTFKDPYGTSAKGKTLLLYTADKEKKGLSFCSTDGKELDIPIVVLINESSASASEIFAGTLKDYGKAEIVGTTSYGKGIVQSVFPLGDGSGVKLTTEHYYTPSGKDLHGEGVVPDVEVQPNEELIKRLVVEHEADNQLQAAIDVLEEGTKAVNDRLKAEAESQEADERP